MFRSAGASGRAGGIFAKSKSVRAARRCNRSERAESRTLADRAGRSGLSAESFPAMECGGTQESFECAGFCGLIHSRAASWARAHGADDAYGAAHGNIASGGGRSIDELSRRDANDARSSRGGLAGKTDDTATRNGDIGPDQNCSVFSFGGGGASLRSRARVQRNVYVLPGAAGRLMFSRGQ